MTLNLGRKKTFEFSKYNEYRLLALQNKGTLIV